jgi:hypothetical protein
MKFFPILLLIVSLVSAKYLTNESCSECHEKIYDEFQSSAHSKTYFSDELHRKVADAVSQKIYDCAPCHMPMANNLKDLISGKARPDIHNITHTDAISCFFCHTIASVKKSHKYQQNIQARQAEGFKPTLFGGLTRADQTDKHSSVKSPIYNKNACKGCHTFKLNDYNVTIFRAISDEQDSVECIKCHMPKIKGGNEKMNKKARTHHVSHKFLGIHDKEFRKKGMDINISYNDTKLDVSLTNKTIHPLIIQAARAKFLKIHITRDGKLIWQNYKNNPTEDKQGYFAYSFSKNGKKIIIPATATEGHVNNIEANSTKVLTYKVPKLQSEDSIAVSFYVQLAKDDCIKAIDINDTNLTKPLLIKEVKKSL